VLAEGFRTIRVPIPEDELAYLAVHAAAHRFGRLAWLHDLRLVVERMPLHTLEAAAARSREWGIARPLAFAGELLVDVLGLAPSVVRPLGALPRFRRGFVHAVVAEPRTRLIASATRFVYATLLADSMSASLQYAGTYSMGHARRLLGRD
jgi:hypothetical protein